MRGRRRRCKGGTSATDAADAEATIIVLIFAAPAPPLARASWHDEAGVGLISKAPNLLTLSNCQTPQRSEGCWTRGDWRGLAAGQTNKKRKKEKGSERARAIYFLRRAPFARCFR